jgi:hypothetical protein
MSNTVLQVKRSSTTAIPPSLANGELAYSGNATSNSLFIGHPDGSTGVIRIAGGKYPYLHQAGSPGVLTANAVVILDANGYHANVYTAGLFVSSSIASPTANATAALITSITPQANGTQLGAAAGGSNTELVTSYAVKTYIDGQITINGVNTATAYTFTNTISFSANVNIAGNTTSVLNIGTNGAANLSANATTLLFNSNITANGSINATSYSGTANNANNLGGTSLATLQTQITGNAATAYSNATTYSSNASNISSGTLSADRLPANVVFWSNTNTFTATQAHNANVTIVGNTTAVLAIGSAAANLVANAVAITLSANTTDNLTINTTAIKTGNSTVYSTVSQTLVNTSSLSVGGQVSINATVASFGTVANIYAPSASLTVSSITTGNLNVTGTLTTIDTQTLQVKDNFVLVADGNANVAADAVDFGIYGVANTASVTTYYGLGRVASGNYFQLFSTTTSPSNTTIAGTSTSTLQAYLQPFGAGGAFVVNASAMALTANSTVSLSLTANTLSLSTALPTTSGGTGYGSYTAGDILYASNTSYLSKLARGGDGTVLQMQGTTVAWASLDGGTF